MNVVLFVGGFFTTAIALLILWLAAEVAIAFAASCSWHRWSIRLQRTHGRVPRWRHLPRSFFHMWWDLMFHRNTGETIWHGKVGSWRGIGDWSVSPPVEVQEKPR